MLRTSALIVLVTALSATTDAAAQAIGTEPSTTAVASAPAVPSHPSYSDPEMRAFAKATLDLLGIRPNAYAKMSQAIQARGMSVEQYNAMGDAMRADPALAARLNPYLDAERMERLSAHPYQVRHKASAHRSVSRRHRAKHHRSRTRHHSSTHSKHRVKHH